MKSGFAESQTEPLIPRSCARVDDYFREGRIFYVAACSFSKPLHDAGVRLSACMIAILIAAGLSAPAETIVRHEVLGLHLGMGRKEALERLSEKGTFVRHERKQQEIWQVRDDGFSHVIVGFNKEGALRFITGVAREDKEAQRIRYDKVGDVAAARQAGDPAVNNFHYQWDLPPKDGRPQTLVSARGRDPDFLTTFSLKRIGADAGSEEKSGAP